MFTTQEIIEAARGEIAVVPMNWRIEYKADPKNPSELTEVEMVDLVKKGSGETTPYTVKGLRKNEILWPAMEKHYDHWKAGQEPPEDGTPIDVLPFLPRQLVDHLKSLHLKTAEDMAAATDNDLQRIGMGARVWRDKARAWLDNKADAGIAGELANLRAELKAMADENKELREQVNSLTAGDERPKRGRPRKDAA